MPCPRESLSMERIPAHETNSGPRAAGVRLGEHARRERRSISAAEGKRAGRPRQPGAMPCAAARMTGPRPANRRHATDTPATYRRNSGKALRKPLCAILACALAPRLFYPAATGRTRPEPGPGRLRNISMTDFSLRRDRLSFSATGIETRSAAATGEQHLPIRHSPSFQCYYGNR